MEYVIRYALDAFLVLLLISTILYCAKRGLMRSLAGIIALIAAAAIAVHFCAPLAEACYGRFLHERVLAIAEAKIQDAEDATLTAEYANGVLKALPDVVVKAAEGVGVDVETLGQKTAQLPHATAASLEQALLAPVVTAALKVLLFLIMLAVIGVLIQLALTPLIKALHKKPVLGKTDRALGAVFGLLRGAVLVAVLAMLLRVAGEIVGTRFAEAVDKSRIISFVENSPFADGLFR